jgi:hypothetical protein
MMESLFNDFGITHNFPEYEYEDKDVKLEGRTYTAHFLKEHSTLEAFIRYSENINAYDAWANHPEYVRSFFIKKKGKDWKRISQEDVGRAIGRINVDNAGIFEILLGFENEIVKKEFKLKKDLERLDELKKECKAQEKKLKKLKKKLNKSKESESL